MLRRLAKGFAVLVAVVVVLAVASLKGLFGPLPSQMVSFYAAPVADAVSHVPGGVYPQVAEVAEVETRVAYRYDLSTHCGVKYARFDARWWSATPQVFKDDGARANPPDDWGNPVTPGKMRLTSEERAEFVGDNGRRATFVALEAKPRDAGCS